MRYLAIGILFFTTTCCFAINQKLIDGIHKYEAAKNVLEKIEISKEVERQSKEYWLKELGEAKNNRDVSDGMRKFYQGKIDAGSKQLNDLGIQYNEAKEMVKKYEPNKNEYDRQVEIEFKRHKLKTAILNITGMLILPLSIFALGLWFVFYLRKRNERLLKEGKMTQEEYEQMMQCDELSMFDDERTNPATGLIMIGGVDAGGNPSGCSFRSDSTFDVYQDYRDRHRFD